MRLLAIVAIACACYAPAVPTGAPCDELHPCPSALICAKNHTCQYADTDVDGSVEMPDSEPPPPPDACVPVAEICDDGIDQDCTDGDASCANNDQPDDAVDVTMGGVFDGDFEFAVDDAPQVGCAGEGGREVFFRVMLAAPAVYYFDTFGSDFDPTLRVFPGVACDAIGSTMPVCVDDACASDQSQLALSLPAGPSCIVVDRKASETGLDLDLRVTRSNRDGTPLGDGVQTKTGDSCTATDRDEPSSQSCTDENDSGRDLAWYFTACPGQTRQLDATTCDDVTMVHYDTVLYVSKAGVGADLSCRDDTSSCLPRPDRPDHADGAILTNINAVGPGLFWLTLDGYDTAACGGYHLVTNLD